MNIKCTKTITVRFYSTTDSDLIELAISKSGVGQSEWARNALILLAEVQVMRGGLIGHALKNILLVRRLIQLNGNHSNEQIIESMNWSKTEFEKILETNNKGKNNGIVQ